MMNKINLNCPLADLDNQPLKDSDGKQILLAKPLANILKEDCGNIDIMKAYDWALSLWKDGIIEVDNTDKKSLINFIKEKQGMTVIFKAQLIKKLEG